MPRTSGLAVCTCEITRYWDADRGLLLDPIGKLAASEHAQTFALLTGLLAADKTQSCLAALRTEPPITVVGKQ